MMDGFKKVAAILCGLAAFAFPGLGRGDEISLGSAPTNAAKAGLSVLINAPRLGNTGFQPLKLTFVSTTGTFAAQRKIRVLFRPRMNYATQLDYQFSCQVTVPQGAKRHEETVLVPNFYRWESCSVRLYEGGRQLGDRRPAMLAIGSEVQDWGQHRSVGIVIPKESPASSAAFRRTKRFGSANNSAGQATAGPTSKTPAWAKFPDLRSFVTVLGDGPIDSRQNISRLNDQQSLSYAQSLNHSWIRFREIGEDAMNDSWLAYSQLDIMLMPFPVLERMEQNQPGQIRAIREWVAAGGELWTYAATSKSVNKSDWIGALPDRALQQFAYVQKPEKALSLNRDNDFSQIDFQPWNYGTTFTPASSYGSGSGAEKRKAVYDELKTANHPMTLSQKRNELLAGVQIMPFGFGRVVAIESEDPFPGSFQLWQGLKSPVQDWDTRHGVNYARGTDSYWAWLMAAVGQPPVTMFVILNGLFVLVMGPLLYFVLRRRARLYLLYFMAPALALLTTLGLFAYAFVLDGFDNRARIRQLTWFDGHSGLSTVAAGESGAAKQYPRIDQSRQTYYTVMDNQKGLTFDSDSLILPVRFGELMPNYSYRQADHSRSGDFEIQRNEDRFLFYGDYLPVRSQVHYLVTDSSTGSMPLDFQFDGKSATVTNRLSTPIESLVACDRQGTFWIAQRIEPGAKADLESVRGNPFQEFVSETVEPSQAEPTVYQNLFSSGDHSNIEKRFLDFSRKPKPGSFMATTEVESSQFALRDCVREQCVRLIGGLLP